MKTEACKNVSTNSNDLLIEEWRVGLHIKDTIINYYKRSTPRGGIMFKGRCQASILKQAEVRQEHISIKAVNPRAIYYYILIYFIRGNLPKPRRHDEVSFILGVLACPKILR